MKLDISKTAVLFLVFASVLSFEFEEVRADQDILDRNLVKNVSISRTERIDPLDEFKIYKGGYNITNKHYWSSAIFTGKFGYIIAMLWNVSGFIYSLILVFSNLCFNQKRALCQKNKRRLGNKYFIWSTAFGLLLTLLIIVASGVALSSSTVVFSRAKAIKNIIVEAANDASSTIDNVTTAVKSIQNKDFVELSNLDSTSQRLSNDADNIRRKADKSMRLLNNGLRIMKFVTIITISLNLCAVLVLVVSRILRFCRVSNILILICWSLTILFWLYFGLYYFLHKFAGDTCEALDEYRQDPRRSTLSTILPCNDGTSATRALSGIGEGIYGIVDQVNANILRLQTPSLPGLVYVCNPFGGPPDYNYQPDNCPSDTIRIQDILPLLKMYTCSSGTCKYGEFVSISDYNRATEAVDSVQIILDAYPKMQSLVSCQLVRVASSKILSEECDPLMKNAYMSWSAFAALSTVMTVLVIVWSVDRMYKRMYRCCDGSVKPAALPEEASDVETGTRQGVI